MKAVGVYKSRKFLFRMLLSFSLLIVVCLLVFSGVLYTYFERDQLRIQYQANEKVLAQVDQNMNYLEQMIRDVAVSVFFDDDLYALRYGELPEDIVTKIHQLNKFYTNSSFLHSIVFYNPRMDRFYANTTGSAEIDNENLFAKLRNYTDFKADIVKMKLTPVYFDNARGNDGATPLFFTYVMHDSLDRYKRGDSMLFVNVKPEWILNNVRTSDSRDYKVFVMNDDGAVIMKDADADDQMALAQKVSAKLSGGSPGGGYSVESFAGDRYVVTSKKVASLGWKVVIVQPLRNILLTDDHLKWVIVAVTATFALLAVTLSVAISRLLYKPIGALTRQIKFPQDMPEGHWRQPQDELGYISSYQQFLTDRLTVLAQDRQDNKAMTRNYVVRRLLVDSGSLSEEELAQTAAALQLDLSGAFRVILLRIDDLHRFKESHSQGEQKLIAFALLNIAQDVLSQQYACETIDMRDDLLAVLVACPAASASSPQANAAGEERETAALMREVARVAQQYYQVSFTTAISGAALRYEAITASYNEALQLLLYRFVHGRGACLTPAVLAEIRPTLPSIAEHEKRILDALRLGDAAGFAEAMRGYRLYLADYAYEPIVSSVMHLILALNQACKEINYNLLHPVDVAFLSPGLLEQETLDDAFEAIAAVGETFFEQRDQARSDRNETIVYSIKEIIGRHYADPNLNVQHIAAMLKMSAVYIGKVFKTAEFISIVDYINDVRLVKAQELLLGKNLTVAEIMERVGYSNHSYFFRLFKKKYGTTPKEFRMTASIQHHKSGPG
ncbi:helix-turn-helix domain-containing protein [Paenibacillus cymbidii]|uniref:helix-turn-helix domain-containing protein n=1 Tax=Paenibacillus cymbidii TaxID=1639034 RepID=UPI0014368CDE|nr:helix-turn-helix domain-containing protein [Paenibacillus cymbidii]